MIPQTSTISGMMTSANSTAAAPRSDPWEASLRRTLQLIAHASPGRPGVESGALGMTVGPRCVPADPPRWRNLLVAWDQGGTSFVLVDRRVEVRRSQRLDVDVLEGQHLHRLGEASRAVHVPHPGVAHGDLEKHVARLRTRLHVDLVAQVEAAVGLDDVFEDADHVAVLAIERQLHLGLVLLEVLGAHGVDPRDSVPGSAQERRWCRVAPSRVSASMWAGAE